MLPAALVIMGALLVAQGWSLATALAAANRVRARQLADSDSAAGRALRRLLDDPLFELVGLPVVVAVGYVLVGIGGAGILAAYDPAIVPALVAAAALLAVQLLAMSAAAQDPERFLLRAARPALWLRPLTRPTTAAFAALARLGGSDVAERARAMRENELRTLVHVDVDEEDGTIEADEMEMIAGIFELSDTKVREVMVPRIDIVAIPLSASLDEALDTILRAGHSRIPVHRATLDDIAGVLYAKDLLRAFRDRNYEPDIGALLRDAYFVPESKPVDELLQELQRRKVHMAIVVDEYGGTAGLVTIEDLLEEIVGEIQDEYDSEEQRVERVSDAEALFDAGVDIDDVNRMMGIELPTDEGDTLAGLVFTRLGKVPEVGERATFDDAVIEVLALSGRRIRRVRVLRKAPGMDDTPVEEPTPADEPPSEVGAT